MRDFLHPPWPIKINVKGGFENCTGSAFKNASGNLEKTFYDPYSVKIYILKNPIPGGYWLVTTV